MGELDWMYACEALQREAAEGKLFLYQIEYMSLSDI